MDQPRQPLKRRMVSIVLFVILLSTSIACKLPLPRIMGGFPDALNNMFKNIAGWFGG